MLSRVLYLNTIFPYKVTFMGSQKQAADTLGEAALFLLPHQAFEILALEMLISEF